MSRISFDNVSFSYPIRLSFGRDLKQSGGSTDPRIEFGANGRARRLRVLSDLTFELNEGDRLAVIGRNGAGKSTLLRMMHGVFTPDAGTIDVDGVTDALFELSAGTKPLASGYQNIILGGLMRGYSKAEIADRTPEIAEFSRLSEFLHMPMSTYSAGMRMRLLFAIATAFEPNILLLDEWVSAGDAQFRKRAAERMNEHVEKAGILVLASHSVKLLRQTCTKAWWLEQGKMIAFGDLMPIFKEFDATVQKGDREVPEKFELDDKTVNRDN